MPRNLTLMIMKLHWLTCMQVKVHVAGSWKTQCLQQNFYSRRFKETFLFSEVVLIFLYRNKVKTLDDVLIFNVPLNFVLSEKVCVVDKISLE